MKLLNYAVLITALFSGIALQGMRGLVGPDRDRVFLRKPVENPVECWRDLPGCLHRYAGALSYEAVPVMTQDQTFAVKDLSKLLLGTRNGVVRRWQILLMSEAFMRVRQGTASGDDYRYAVQLPRQLPLDVSDVDAYVEAVYKPALQHQEWQQWQIGNDMMRGGRLVVKLVDTAQDIDPVTKALWKRFNELGEKSMRDAQELSRELSQPC